LLDDEDEEDGDATFNAAAAAKAAAPQQQKKFRAAADKLMQSNKQRGAVETPAPADNNNGMPLPAALGQAVVARCDNRAAAAAAASCKQLHAAHAAHCVMQMPTGLKAYLEAVAEILHAGDDGWGDGSYEASFASRFPLDGSAAVGADLVRLTMSDQV
jgi:hypothetical protein